MIDYSKELVSTLNAILPTHYEMKLTSNTKVPCISYMELTNIDTDIGNTIGYSAITYQIKIWGHEIATIQEYAIAIDKALRPLGFKRISSGVLYDNNSTMIQKILSYEVRAFEKYN